MAERRRSSSWLRILWRSQPDGSFLIRPLGASPLVFLTDAPTKERLARFVRAYHVWQFWVFFLSGLITLPVIVTFWQDWFWWACAAELALCWPLAIAFLWIGELVILRNAVLVPTTAWPEMTTAAPRPRWWRSMLLLVGSALLLVAVAEGPRYLPFFPLMWIAPVLVIAILVLLIRWQIANQRAIATVAGIGPAPPADPATRQRRILLGSLAAALANPIAVVLLVGHVSSKDAIPLGSFGLLLALSGGCGLLLGLYFLVTRSSGGIRWHLTAAAIAVPALSAIFYFVAFSPMPLMQEAFWLSVVSAAAIAFPVAAAFWLIARPERYA